MQIGARTPFPGYHCYRKQEKYPPLTADCEFSPAMLYHLTYINFFVFSEISAHHLNLYHKRILDAAVL